MNKEHWGNQKRKEKTKTKTKKKAAVQVAKANLFCHRDSLNYNEPMITGYWRTVKAINAIKSRRFSKPATVIYLFIHWFI